MIKLDVKKLNPEAKLPTRSNPHDAGLDLYALEDVFIPQGKTVRIATGVAIHILPEYVGLVRDRSGMATKGLIVGAGVIDAGYAGDASVVLHNFSNVSDTHEDHFAYEFKEPMTYPSTARKYPICGYQVRKGDKIAQLLIQKVELPVVDEVSYSWETSARGTKGFGSSGR